MGEDKRQTRSEEEEAGRRRGWKKNSGEDELKMDEVGAECSRGEMGPSVDAEDEIGFS